MPASPALATKKTATQLEQALNSHKLSAKIMATKLANIQGKLTLALEFLRKHNGPIMRRMFPKISQIITLLEEILEIITQKPAPTLELSK